jgi:hypothetical protein
MLRLLADEILWARLLLAVAMVIVLVWVAGLGWFIAHVPH